jgi:hypothetical protein
MKVKTLTALKASIKHWQENLRLYKKGLSFDYGASACALCRLFKHECSLCPVKGCTGIDTFWYNAACQNEKPVTPSGINAIEAEINFLKSLLPKRK